MAKCPVCNTVGGNYFVPANEYKILKCSLCGLEYTDPTPSDGELKAFYSAYSDFKAPSDVVQLNTQKNIELLKRFGYSAQHLMLDYGTGDADFVKIAGDHCYGVDFKKSHVDRVYEELDSVPIKLFDFITLWGVLEHLSDPVRVIDVLTQHLKTDGVLALTTVNAEGIIPYYYKPVEHLTYWTKKSFELLFKRCGLRMIHIEPYTMFQRKEIYMDRLLSRTPEPYKKAFDDALSGLPQYLEVPTNEVIVLAEKKYRRSGSFAVAM